MKIKNIADIFFDLDHTLWDFDKNSALAFQSIFLKHQLEIKVEDFLSTYIPINNQYWQLYRNEKVSKEELRYNRLSETFIKLKFSVKEELIHQLAEDYILHLPAHNYLLDGAIEILDYLSKKYRLHIITNGFEKVQHTKLKNAAIDHFFTTITTSEDVGVKKPHPLIFEKALKKGNAEHSKSLMIGDNLEADIIGAQQVGIQTIYFQPLENNYKGTKIDNLKTLRSLL